MLDVNKVLSKLHVRFRSRQALTQFVGIWAHTSEMTAYGYLQFSLAQFGLMVSKQPPPPGKGGDTRGVLI